MNTIDAAMAGRVLDTPMDPDRNDASATTICGYLTALLSALWREGEDFSGKRPLGNSGWKYDLYVALVRAELVEGTFDEDGFVEEVDDQAADKLVAAAIRHMGATP